MIHRSRLLLGFLVALVSGAALAKDFPEKPIRVIVATSAGTTTDLLSRALGPEMSRLIGQPLVIEDRPGANQIIGLEHVAKQAAADGYTIAVVGLEGLALLPVTSKELRFDAFRDLPPVIGLAEGRYVLRSPVTAPWKTFAEMVAYVKANPGKMNYGSSAAQVRVPMLLLMRELGLDILHIPYGGGAKYLQALAAGEVHLGFTGEGALAGSGDRVRWLAVTGEQRVVGFKDVPTFSELRFPQLRGPSYTINVRAGTPAEATEKIYASASRALQSAEVKSSLAKLQLEILNDTAQVAAKKLLDAGRFYAEFAKAADIKPE